MVACNTASAFALEAVQEEFDIPILGVIEAGAKVAAQVTRNKRVGIIGTEGTVGSGIHAEDSEKDRSGDYSDRKVMSLICTVGRGRLDS